MTHRADCTAAVSIGTLASVLQDSTTIAPPQYHSQPPTGKASHAEDVSALRRASPTHFSRIRIRSGCFKGICSVANPDGQFGNIGDECANDVDCNPHDGLWCVWPARHVFCFCNTGSNHSCFCQCPCKQSRCAFTSVQGVFAQLLPRLIRFECICALDKIFWLHRTCFVSRRVAPFLSLC